MREHPHSDTISLPIMNINPTALLIKFETRRSDAGIRLRNSILIKRRNRAPRRGIARITVVIEQTALERLRGVGDVAAGGGVECHAVVARLVHVLEDVGFAGCRPDAFAAEHPDGGPEAVADGDVVRVDDDHGAGVEGLLGGQTDRVAACGRDGGVVDADVGGGFVRGLVVDVADEFLLCGEVEVRVVDVAVCGVWAGEGREVVKEVGAGVVGDEAVCAAARGCWSSESDTRARGGQRQRDRSFGEHLARRCDVVVCWSW